MAAEQASVRARRRSRVAEASARTEALERLKALRQSGRRAENAFRVKAEDPIYDTVEEDEYDAIVAKRKEEFAGFIVDDDGFGYRDEGEEVDWSQSGVPLSSEESDPDTERPKKKKSEKKDRAPKKPNIPAAPPSSAGKHRISLMFTSSVFKKSREDKVKAFSSDSIVDDVIAEFAPDESDRERRRHRQTQSFHGVKNAVSVKPEKIEKPSGNVSSTIIIPPAGAEPLGSVSSDMLPTECDDCMDTDKEDRLSVKVKEEPVESKGYDRANDSISDALKINSVQCNGELLSCKEENTGKSAIVEWQSLTNTEKTGLSCNGVDAKDPSMAESKSEFELQPDGSLLFYMLDAYEEIYGPNMGNVYLFGKVRVEGTFYSCCVIVKNMQRCVYAIPCSAVFHNETVKKLEKDFEENNISSAAFRSKLQDVASDLKSEITKHLLDLNISTYCLTPVKRSYAFDRSDIPVGENYVLKINYPIKDPPLPSDAKGKMFCAFLGTHSSALELFIIKRKIKGPSWLCISNFASCPAPQHVSWCKFEITINNPKYIQVSTSKITVEAPPVVVTAINLKTILNDSKNANEIVSASLISCRKAKIDTPMLASEWKKPDILSHFTVVRKLVGGIFPVGFTKDALDRNNKAKSTVLGIESSERALLNRLMIELHKLDSDVIVGHNISGFDLDVLLNRAQACKVPGTMWSKIGRLKRSVMPKITKSGTYFGSGASAGIVSCIAGRLLCDTYLCSRDLLKEVSYSLTQLAKTQLNKDRKEIVPHDIPMMFEGTNTLMELVEYGETDAWLSLELMFHLSILPLTRQLTNISGNLWGKTLQGARAQRVEYLLLHAFHGKKYVVPDKISSQEHSIKSAKRKNCQGIEDEDVDLYINEANIDDKTKPANHGKSKKGPAYIGGLVLEPKRGLYDKIVLLLDFNSLYPSIIQEYNICFTTVERNPDGSLPRLPSSRLTGVLPELLKSLVERRRMVKSWLKSASGLKAQQFDIQQQALKLTANSMYGCLGFSNSRFYAKPLAELITLQGREILQSTVDLVQNNLNLEVIYGDTDSIMIYSGHDDLVKAKAIAGKVIQEVNKKYRCLEIDLDGMYKRMLLLKKKKYAAVKVQFKDGKPYEVIERKGLDMVRRDWSLLSKEVGDFCLGQILSGGSCEDVVESIHDSLMKVQNNMRNGEIELEKYTITKSLTKPPESYPDKNQPHVQVALRLKETGYATGCNAGDTVPYIICCEQGSNTGPSIAIAQRARHPEEFKRDQKWMVDIEYYLSQQIHPVVSRLCASIQGTSPARLAECLGLEPSKFQSRRSDDVGNDSSLSLLLTEDDEERYRSCQPLALSCLGCSRTFDCPPVISFLRTIIDHNALQSNSTEPITSFWANLHCPNCPEDGDLGKISSALLSNQVKKQSEKFISVYYKGIMICDDETCTYSSRALNLRVVGDSERGTVCPNYPQCNGRLCRKYTEADLYMQLTYFCHVLDTTRCVEKMDAKARMPLEKELARIRATIDLAASTVQGIRDRCAYGWVQLDDLAVTV